MLQECKFDHKNNNNLASVIPGLQITDISHDARLTALEENGSGSGSNGWYDTRKTS